jgi:hypothetical protein
MGGGAQGGASECLWGMSLQGELYMCAEQKTDQPLDCLHRRSFLKASGAIASMAFVSTGSLISFSFGSHACSVSSPAKHFCSTPIAMKAAVEAPGEAPRSATRLSSRRRGYSIHRVPHLSAGSAS